MDGCAGGARPTEAGIRPDYRYIRSRELPSFKEGRRRRTRQRARHRLPAQGRTLGSQGVRAHHDGTEHRVSKYGKTAEEASAELAKALADHHRGIPESSASQYTGEYLIYRRDHIAADKVRPS